MAIVETKKSVRPNPTVEFFNQTNNAALIQSREDCGYVFTEVESTGTYLKRTNADGSVVNEFIISNDGLLQTTISTFSNLTAYSLVDTAKGIALDYEYKQYIEGENYGSLISAELNGQKQYTQTGIDQPFSCTTTYTYGANISSTYPLFDSFVAVIEYSDKLHSLVNNGSSVVAVHHYLNSEDFTENHWDDYKFIEALHTGGVTRTISYAMI
jgi:hypothetical protein